MSKIDSSTLTPSLFKRMPTDTVPALITGTWVAFSVLLLSALDANVSPGSFWVNHPQSTLINSKCLLQAPPLAAVAVIIFNAEANGAIPDALRIIGAVLVSGATGTLELHLNVGIRIAVFAGAAVYGVLGVGSWARALACGFSMVSMKVCILSSTPPHHVKIDAQVSGTVFPPAAAVALLSEVPGLKQRLGFWYGASCAHSEVDLVVRRVFSPCVTGTFILFMLAHFKSRISQLRGKQVIIEKIVTDKKNT